MIRRFMPWSRGPNWFDEASAYVDGELSSEQVVAIERELQRSPSLRAYVGDLRAVQVTMQAMPEPVPRRSYTLSAADAERLRPGYRHGGGRDLGAGRTGGIFASFAGGLSTIRLAATFSTVATAALVAVVLVDLTVDEGLPSQSDSRFSPTAARTEAFGQAANTDLTDADTAAAQSTVAAAPVAPVEAGAQSLPAPDVREDVEQAVAQSEQSAPVAVPSPTDDRESPGAESADEASDDAAGVDDGSPALAAAAPAPPPSDDAAEIRAPVPPGTTDPDDEATTTDPERDGPPLSGDETDSTTVGTGGGLADEPASDEAIADTDEPSPPEESVPASEATSADGEAAVADPEVSADLLPATGQDDAVAAPGEDQDASSATDAAASEPSAVAPAPRKPAEAAAPTDEPTAELTADQLRPQPLPAADEAAPVGEDSAAALSRAGDGSDVVPAAGESEAAVEILNDDDDGSLLLALEIALAVAAGSGVIAALWFRRRTYGR